jgi:hypothetical protein
MFANFMLIINNFNNVNNFMLGFFSFILLFNISYILKLFYVFLHLSLLYFLLMY